MTREQLIDSLAATRTDADLTLETSDGYIDFGSVDGDRRCFELSADGDTAQMWMTRSEIAELQRKLTLLLLAEPA